MEDMIVADAITKKRWSGGTIRKTVVRRCCLLGSHAKQEEECVTDRCKRSRFDSLDQGHVLSSRDTRFTCRTRIVQYTFVLTTSPSCERCKRSFCLMRRGRKRQFHKNCSARCSFRRSSKVIWAFTGKKEHETVSVRKAVPKLSLSLSLFLVRNLHYRT